MILEKILSFCSDIRQENNWIQMVPNKIWYILLRLYGPLDTWFDKTWQPGEIELVK